MNINKNNYEAFFLDYHEGNLSPQQVADLLLFLEQYPELKEEFESFENVTLENLETVQFEYKNELKKNITDDLLISSLEGLLTREEKFFLDKELSADARLHYEFSLYRKTKLTADVSIVFENKEALKRKIKKVVPLYYYVAAAASVALLLGLFFMFNFTSAESQLVDKEVRSQESEARSLAIEPSVTDGNKQEENNLVNLSVLSDLVVEKEVRNQKPGSRIQKLEVAKEEKNLVIPIAIGSNDLVVEKTENNKQQPFVIRLPADVGAVLRQAGKDSLFVEPLANSSSPVVQLENKNKVLEPTEILSLRELAVVKMKEKIVDEKTLAAEKKNGRLKKLNGWDLAQFAAKGFNKLTGRSVEVNPTYNEQGDVIAYSLGAGEFQLSRGR